MMTWQGGGGENKIMQGLQRTGGRQALSQEPGVMLPKKTWRVQASKMKNWDKQLHTSRQRK